MTVPAYIGVGSNAEPEENIPRAMGCLREKVEVTATSTFYKTKPLAGRQEQPAYLNGVWKVAAREDQGARAIKEVLRDVESRLGRVRSADRYAQRTIDLDLLLYGTDVVAERDLRIPDPDIYIRPFVGIPLAELDPLLVLPDTGRSIQEVVRSFGAPDMEPQEDFTLSLRRLLSSKEC